MDQYYLYINEEQKGPYELEQLRAMWAAGTITAETLYWKDGFADWLPLSGITDRLKSNPHTLMYVALCATGFVIVGLIVWHFQRAPQPVATAPPSSADTQQARQHTGEVLIEAEQLDVLSNEIFAACVEYKNGLRDYSTNRALGLRDSSHDAVSRLQQLRPQFASAYATLKIHANALPPDSFTGFASLKEAIAEWGRVTEKMEINDFDRAELFCSNADHLFKKAKEEMPSDLQ